MLHRTPKASDDPRCWTISDSKIAAIAAHRSWGCHRVRRDPCQKEPEVQFLRFLRSHDRRLFASQREIMYAKCRRANSFRYWSMEGAAQMQTITQEIAYSKVYDTSQFIIWLTVLNWGIYDLPFPKYPCCDSHAVKDMTKTRLILQTNGHLEKAQNGLGRYDLDHESGLSWTSQVGQYGHLSECLLSW